MSLSPPRVLVTGAAGFVGAPCLPDLVARGYDVHAVSSGDRIDDRGGITWHRVDLLDGTSTGALVTSLAPTHLLHLAWETTHARFWSSDQNLRWLAAGVELFRSFAEAGGRRAVVAGTCAEYLWNDEPCVEGRTPIEPQTLYGACKHALHVAARAYASLTGVSLAWGRVFFPYGPGEKPDRLVPSVVTSLLQAEPALCSHGRQVRDFVHVEDAARAFVDLLAGDVAGPVNIGSGVGTSIADVARTIGEIVGRPDLVRLGAIPSAPNDPALLVADVGRLTHEVGWRPHHDLRSGLEQTVEWWRSRSPGERDPGGR